MFVCSQWQFGHGMNWTPGGRALGMSTMMADDNYKCLLTRTGARGDFMFPSSYMRNIRGPVVSVYKGRYSYFRSI